MQMKTLYLLPFLFLAITTFAQKQFVVQNGTAQTFETLVEAVDAASAGDTIYLPGGGFNFNSQIVDKQLHWRGVGHYPDSTLATGFTNVICDGYPYVLRFTKNASGSTFEGIYFQGSLQFGTVSNEEVTDVTIKYCRITGSITLRYDINLSNGFPDLNFHLLQSVVGTMKGNSGRNCLIENNLIFGTCEYFHYSIFNHNTFAYSSYHLSNSTNCRYTNNVFTYNPGLSGSSNCEFQNNTFNGGLPYNPELSTFTGSGNLTGVNRDQVFKSITANLWTFDYPNDYHLNDIAGTNENGDDVSILGIATDGTNPGIYGGAPIKQYKEGAVPYNPHVRTVDIANEAVNGELDVKITVAAQEK